MFWMVDDDGTAMFRFRMPDHGPAVSASVDRIINDMAAQGIATITSSVLIRKRRGVGEEVVWSGRIEDTEKVSAARKYLETLAISSTSGWRS
jgi:hypothetical protein